MFVSCLLHHKAVPPALYLNVSRLAYAMDRVIDSTLGLVMLFTATGRCQTDGTTNILSNSFEQLDKLW
jgi:hypothetical protein